MPYLSAEVPRPEITFFKEKEPHRDEEGRLVVEHARELNWKSAVAEWKWRNHLIQEAGITASDCQIAVLAHPHDVTTPLWSQLSKDNPFPRELAITMEDQYSNREWGIEVRGGDPRVRSVYLFGSLVDEFDFQRMLRVADHYRNTLNAEVVTCVCPFIGGTREDKNVDKFGVYKDRTLTLRTAMLEAKCLIDRWIVFEPHSSAAQAYAADAGMSFLPLSPWKYMGDDMFKRVAEVGIKPENCTVLRPDKGRNLAASRAAKLYGLSAVAFDKKRLSGTDVEVYGLSDDDQRRVTNKYGLVFDDVAATMKTLREIGSKAMNYGSLGILACLMHGEFTPGVPGWRQFIEDPMFVRLLVSNSREAIGNIGLSGKIEQVDWTPLILEILRADIDGVVFWEDSRYRDMVLQTQPDEIEE